MGDSRLETDFARDRYRITFGPFDLRLDTQELRKHGIRMRLQGKPFQLLRALLEEPGRIVTRDELRNKLWSSGTFVDFESGLNTAVNRLRIALGDSAENPIYVETLARSGYRFIAPVRILPVAPGGVTYGSPDAEDIRLGKAPDFRLEPLPRPVAQPRFLRHWKTFAVIGLMIALGAGAILLERNLSQTAVTFHQLTFLRGFVGNARFASSGTQVVYSAEWNGEPNRLFATDVNRSRVQKIPAKPASLESVSPGGTIAFFENGDTHPMVLESKALRGGGSQVLSDGALGADWGPNEKLCLVTRQNSTYSIQYPAGHPVYTSTSWIDALRVSPRGDQIAFLEHPIPEDDGGRVMLVSASGKSQVLSSGWGSAKGLAWHPTRREVWFTAARSGVNRALMAVDLNGRTRQIAQVPGGMELLDIAPSGSVLISRSTPQMMMLSGTLNGKPPQNISYLDWSRAAAISADGKTVLFDESGEGGGKRYSVYLQDVDKQSFERLGEGRAIDLSPDGRWALTQAFDNTSTLVLHSVKEHKTIPFRTGGFQYTWAKFLPQSKCPEILFEGGRPGEKTHIYRQRLPNGSPVLLNTDVRLTRIVIDTTGSLAAGCTGDSRIAILDLAQDKLHFLPTSRRVTPVGFLNNRELLTSYRQKASLDLEILNIETNHARPYGRIDFPDPVGSAIVFPLHLAKDLRTFVYSRLQTLSALYLVSGWR